jgi:DNA-binding NarL/FixJ family response regulator
VAIKIVVADDMVVIRLAIVGLLKTDPQLDVVGEADSFEKTFELITTAKPDVLILDLHMRDERQYSPEDVKMKVLQEVGCILAVSVWNDNEAQALAGKLGAVTLLDKAHLFAELIPAIKRFCLPNPDDERARAR